MFLYETVSTLNPIASVVSHDPTSCQCPAGRLTWYGGDNFSNLDTKSALSPSLTTYRTPICRTDGN